MGFLIVITLILITAAVVLFWPEPDAGDRPAAEPEAGGPAVRAATSPTTLEGALAAQLVGGEISREQYRTAVARLAARDDERNPLSVPGQDRPDACA